MPTMFFVVDLTFGDLLTMLEQQACVTTRECLLEFMNFNLYASTKSWHASKSLPQRINAKEVNFRKFMEACIEVSIEQLKNLVL